MGSFPFQSLDQDAPQSSPAAPTATPSPNTTPIPQTSKSGPVKTYLMNFLEGFGEAAKHEAGLPTDLEKQTQLTVNQRTQAQTQNETAEANLKNTQATLAKNTIPYVMPNGATVQLPTALATKLAQADIAAKGKLGASVNALKGTLGKVGLAVETDESGQPNIRPMRPDEMSPIQEAQISRQNWEGELAKARADLINDPNNPTFQQNERKIQAQLAMANQRIQVALQGNQRQNAQFGINNGVMPDGSPPVVVGAGQAVDESGNPIGKNFTTLNTPTAPTRTSGTQAGAVASHIPDLRAQIDNLAAQGKLGALNGRINTWLNSGYGGDDPDIAKFVSTLSLINSGTMKAHFGARGGAQLMQGFKNILNSSQEPNAMKGSLSAFESFLNTYKDAGTVHTTANTTHGAKIDSLLGKYK